MKKSLRLFMALPICIVFAVCACNKEDSDEPVIDAGANPTDSLLKKMPARFKITEYESDGSSAGGFFFYQYDSAAKTISVKFDNQNYNVYAYDANGYLTSMWGGKTKFTRTANKLTRVQEKRPGAGDNHRDTADWEILETPIHTLLKNTTSYVYNDYERFDTTIKYFKNRNLAVCDSVTNSGSYGPNRYGLPPYFYSAVAYKYDVQDNMISMSNKSWLEISVEYENKTNPLNALNKLLLGKDAHFLQPTAFELYDLVEMFETVVMLTPFNSNGLGYERRFSLFHSANLVKSIAFYYKDEQTQTARQDTFYFTNTFDNSGRLVSIAIKLGTKNYYEMKMEYN